MDPVSPLPSMVVLLVAFATAFLLAARFGAPSLHERFATIDGLRGYLALFVFLHHACIWYFYLRGGKFDAPPSNLYTCFGQVGVSFFFMITGFLFYSRLIDARSKGIDWLRLYVSRFLRLTPLYFFFMLLYFLLVAWLSQGVLNEPVAKVLGDAMKWLGFRILGAPDLNGVTGIAASVAGITWTLPMEWGFYTLLPLLALTARITLSAGSIALVLVLVIACFVGAAILYPVAALLLPFLTGIAAALLIRLDSFRRFAVGKACSLVALGCVGLALTAFSNAYNAAPLALLSVAFLLIAAGNTLFGALLHPVSRTLGMYSYGIYLLHSIGLFALFHFVVGLPESRSLSPIAHWLAVLGMTPVLIGVCFLTFRFIEQPAMHRVTRVTAWLRSRSGG